ncbi:kappa-casein [Sciurus carolinensis]|nr:kappa-casein [Sciurus carolinensis]
MKGFLLIVNVMVLTLPLLAAEVQDQEQTACNEKFERPFDQKIVPYVPIHYALNRYPNFEPNYYQRTPIASINNPYMIHPYYAKAFVLRSHAQIPQWHLLPNIHHPTMVQHHPYRHSSFMAIPPKKSQDKTTIPANDIKNTVEPTPIPTNEQVASTTVIPEASSKFINTPEPTTVPVTSPVA